MVTIDDFAPDFMAETTAGRFAFHDWIGGSWCLLVAHPDKPTPICAGEVAALAALRGAFLHRACKVIGLVARPADRLGKWQEAVGALAGRQMVHPLIGDRDWSVAKRFGLVPIEASVGFAVSGTGAARAAFLIAPDKRIRLILTYPAGIARNFDEILRALDGLQDGGMHPVPLPLRPSARTDRITFARTPAIGGSPSPCRR